MTTRYLLLAVFATWTLSTRARHALAGHVQDNHPPVVKIQSPAAGATASAGRPIPYEITVADREDGDSRYDEINPKEVTLEIRAGAMTPKTAASKGDAPASSTDPLKAPGLAAMARSNCFNCHQFNGKLIGPSLADIARRYNRFTAAITDTLIHRIKDGSAGIWGKEKMPSHPELSVDDIRAIVRWIEKYAAAPGVNYQNGITGVLQFPASGSTSPAAPGSTAASPASPGSPRPGVYTLTAVYTDHGNKDTRTGPFLTGLDQQTLTLK